MWPIAGAVLCICLSAVGSGETLTDGSRGVFRPLTGSRADGVGAGHRRRDDWLDFRNNLEKR